MIGGLWKYGADEADGLQAILAALPGCETDAYERWAEAPVALGWRGRAIGDNRDEAEGLPQFDATSGLAVTASARLDGRIALSRALGLPRPDWAGLPDGALILKSYARWGRACPEHLLGDYAFVLWDAKQEVLFCARDHIGARPFYYALAGNSFVFASTIEAVLAAPGVSDALDEEAVATRLTYGARSLGARTCYRAVRRLLPGHALSVERETLRVHRWWRPEAVPPTPHATDDALAEACLVVLSDAVRDRLRDARSVGVHLSGGLDSSAVAVLAAHELRRAGRPAPPAFTWHPPPGPGRSSAEAAEYGRLEALRRQEGLQLFYQPPMASDVIAFLRGDGASSEEEGTLVHEEIVQRTAAGQGVEVLLSGWGGDEGISFNGRGYYPQLLRNGQASKLWRELRERNRHPLAALVAQALVPAAAPWLARAARQFRRGKLSSRKNATFIHPEFARRARPLPAADRPRAGVREVQLHLLQLGHLSRRTEGWATSGARHGIEYRYPLLDRRVLEFALSLPPEQYRRGGRSRWIMRRALDPVLPPEVCWNPDKSDPARLERLRDAIAEALPMARRMIEAHNAPPLRSHYLDMPRLMMELDPERWRASGRFSPVLNALRFLDF